MGNSIGGGGKKRRTKVMKIDGETLKLKTPVTAEEVLTDYPGFVLLDSEAVKHYGVRAKPLGAAQRLEAKRLYFLVEPPRESIPPRRVRSGIQMSAKERLESLMLARRSASDLSIINPSAQWTSSEEREGGGVRMKMRIRKEEMEKLVRESATEAEATERIVDLFKSRRSSEGGLKVPPQKRVSFIEAAGSEITVAF